jgi:FlaA1/EpsC-like NDP-sugar epimerase
MQEVFKDERLRFLIGDIRDKDRLSRAMDGIDCVINCAALKHVPICQYNPMEAVKTNIVGLMNVIDAAEDNGVKKVLSISSDKAVYPINIYGASKLAGEQLVINANVYGKTKFSCYRPGNYFESRGNVFELWDEQAKTGECTLTDEGMYRYFIELEEAARIALICLKDMQGGETFVPIMKEYKMIDLLKARYPDVEIKIIGMRNGERLHEPLFTNDEERRVKVCENYYLIK